MTAVDQDGAPPVHYTPDEIAALRNVTVEQFLRISAEQRLPNERRWAHEQGRIVPMNTEYAPHTRVQTTLLATLCDAYGYDGRVLSSPSIVPVEPAYTTPQPDALVLRDGAEARYPIDDLRPVDAADVWAIFEVCSSTHDKDLRPEGRPTDYAGIPHYAVLDLDAKAVIVPDGYEVPPADLLAAIEITLERVDPTGRWTFPTQG